MSGRRSGGYRRYPFTILWVAAYLVFLWLSSRTDMGWLPGVWLMIGLGIPLTVLLALDWSGHLPRRKLCLWLVLAGAAWWLATALLVRGDFGWRVWHPLNTVSLLLVTLSAGYWLAGEIERAGHLIPVCIVGTLVDIWSVFQGPSLHVGRQVQEHFRQVEAGIQAPPPLTNFLILHWPLPGADTMSTLFGLGDLVFVAFFLAASRRFGIPLVRTLVLLLIGLGLAVGVAFWCEKPIPALPFICGLFLLGNYRGLSLTAKEWKITWAMAGALVLIGLISYLT